MINVDLHHDLLDYATLAVAFLGAVGTVIAALIAVRVAGADARDRRRDQASRVSAWVRHTEGASLGDDAVVIVNGSTGSIYEVVMTWGAVQGAAPAYRAPADGTPVCIPKVAPGQWIAPAPEYHGAGMQMVFDAAISFRDGAGRSWRRDANGTLLQTDRSPLDDLGVDRPVSYSSVRPYTGY